MIETKLAQFVRTTRARPMLPLAFVAHEITQAQIALVARWLLAQASLKPLVVAERSSPPRARSPSLLVIPGRPS